MCFIRLAYLPKCVVSDFETHNFMKNNWKMFNTFTRKLCEIILWIAHMINFTVNTKYGPVYMCICRPVCSADKLDRTIDVGLSVYEFK